MLEELEFRLAPNDGGQAVQVGGRGLGDGFMKNPETLTGYSFLLDFMLESKRSPLQIVREFAPLEQAEMTSMYLRRQK